MMNQMIIRLEERSFKLQKLTRNQLDMMNQLIIVTQEAKRKDMEIISLRSLNEKLRNELRTEKELLQRMNKPSEVVIYFEELMRSPRSTRDTFGLGYNKYFSFTKEGESSKSGELRNIKLKKNKPTCYYCGKPGHTTNICKRKIGKKNPKPKFNGNYFNCKK